MIITNLALRASLAIYHLTSNARSWNNYNIVNYNDHLVKYLVNSDWLSIDFDHVHDFNGIISILLSKELNKPIALMQLGDAIFWHMHID